ncbi:MAG: CBS domain-containing protein YhcV [Nitrospirales bacterium]|nr:MAG: CBS domain-containing protein YhcV [Nitrospirales bacterium]
MANASLTVKDVMTFGTETIQAKQSIKEAAAKMRQCDMGILPAVNNRELVGMISDRDITVRSVAEGRDPNTTMVQDVMTRNFILCHEHQKLDEASQLMKDKQVRRLLVVNDDKEVVGIIALGDIANSPMNEERTGEVLQGISQSRI